eukprot:scaffold32824_cov112-Isochrysis_galbana.AAC.2
MAHRRVGQCRCVKGRSVLGWSDIDHDTDATPVILDESRRTVSSFVAALVPAPIAEPLFF